MKIFSIFIF